MTSEQEDFGKAIDIIAQVSGDPIQTEAIVIEMAKRHPKILVQIWRSLNGNDWKDACREMLEKEPKRIPAIKLCREKTGLGLKEAKDEIDKMCGEMGIAIPAIGRI